MMYENLNEKVNDKMYSICEYSGTVGGTVFYLETLEEAMAYAKELEKNARNNIDIVISEEQWNETFKAYEPLDPIEIIEVIDW